VLFTLCFRISHGFVTDSHRNISVINTTSDYYNRKVFSVSADRNGGGEYESEVLVYDFGKQLTYECEPGYVFHPEREKSELGITCEENGAWKGEVTDCVMIECPAPLPLEHGNVTPRNNDRDARSERQNASNVSHDANVYLYGSEIEISCEVGYRLTGPSILECMENGKWSFPESQCEHVMCALSTLVLYSDPPTSITENGAFSISGNLYDDLADFTCKPGYRLTLPMFTSSWSLMKLTWTCQLNGSWVLFNNIDTGSEFINAVLKSGQALCQPFQYKCSEPKVRFHTH
jgi:hypothetical protein